MEDGPVSSSLLQWLGTWALAAGACCTPARQPETEYGEKPRDNGEEGGEHGA